MARIESTTATAGASDTQRLAGFRPALDDSIEHIKRYGGGSRVRGRDGRLLREFNGQWLYVFRLDEPRTIDDDQPVEMQIGGRPVQGNMVSVRGDEIVIAANEDLGPEPGAVELLFRPYYLRQLLARADRSDHEAAAAGR